MSGVLIKGKHHIKTDTQRKTLCIDGDRDQNEITANQGRTRIGRHHQKKARKRPEKGHRAPTESQRSAAPGTTWLCISGLYHLENLILNHTVCGTLLQWPSKIMWLSTPTTSKIIHITSHIIHWKMSRGSFSPLYTAGSLVKPTCPSTILYPNTNITRQAPWGPSQFHITWFKDSILYLFFHL